ncbi:hypothetical protein [Crenobacter cavernae]|uniref:Ead/Ea22-like family protein n=1 Tax=Crenobacter cavernae TaxID=2290923 RepID=A0ABY0FB27_9NEIS|nr:hypothetical protein [Crenobacter cavernae]RXZ42655.1 hypothetical protein EBB06_12225 [Crenobacter cavernae]
MSEIKRFDVLLEAGQGYREIHPDGAYVTYDDHQRELAALADERDRAMAQLAEVEALTDEQIMKIFYPMGSATDSQRHIALAIGRAIERSAIAAHEQNANGEGS